MPIYKRACRTSVAAPAPICSLLMTTACAGKFRVAQRDQMLPTVNALGVAGQRASVTGNISPTPPIVPSGSTSSCRSSLASAIAQRRSERHTRNASRRSVSAICVRIVRDVYTSWLSANSSFQRLAVTQHLLKQSDLAAAGRDAVQAGRQLNRRIKPGPIATDRGRNRRRKRAINTASHCRHSNFKRMRNRKHVEMPFFRLD